ncbi:hypothetical protein [Sanguibacter gelidistatuariae]|uniref:hypothetical protein n=1 Tax=Sanguibacter gelidistatuariae TaxID=1814289 RepID=UPI001FE07D72|nr:hypothetical protein [Sanguibacter gelidistatuariae]
MSAVPAFSCATSGPARSWYATSPKTAATGIWKIFGYQRLRSERATHGIAIRLRPAGDGWGGFRIVHVFDLS